MKSLSLIAVLISAMITLPACRPSGNAVFREFTYLGDDARYVILPSGERVPTVVGKSALQGKTGAPLTGNFTWTDRFDSLDFKWMQLRTPKSQWWQTDGGLHITPRIETIYDEGANPSFMAVRQQHSKFEAQTLMDYEPQADGFAGLVVFQNESNNFALGKRMLENKPYVVLYKADKEIGRCVVAAEPLNGKAGCPLWLKVAADGDEYMFYYSESGTDDWNQIGGIQDGKILSTWYAGGFTGTMIGCYATCAVADNH